MGEKAYQLAVRVPRGTRSDRFGVVVYPLQKLESDSSGARRRINGQGLHTDTLPAASRDDLATRTFAILQTENNDKENPWDLGFWRNWQSVMGTYPWDWLLPIRHSPCANHESHESFYPMGRVIQAVRERYGLPPCPPSDESTVMEMRNLRA